MKHYFKLLSLVVLTTVCFASVESFAQDVAAEKTPNNTEAEQKPEFIYDKKVCEEASANIAKDLMTNTACWKDEDCVGYDFGYPWQKSACLKTIISKDEKEKIIPLLGRIEVYKEACINTNEAELKKYNELDKQIKTESCSAVPLLCLKGVCRTSTYAIIETEKYKMKEEVDNDSAEPEKK